MNALRFVFRLIDRMSGPARNIRNSLVGVHRGLSQTGREIDRIVEKTRQLRSYTMLTVTALGALAAAGGAALGAYAVSAASFKETTLTTLTTLMQSREKAQKLYMQAIRFASVTPFEPQQTIDLFTRLLGSGFKPIEIPVVASAIGDLSSLKGFSQEAVDRITTAIQQIKSKGVLQGEEITGQLADANFPVLRFYETLAKKLGVTRMQVMKLQKAGKITADLAIWGILETTRKYVSGGKLGGAMQAQSETLKGLWSTLKGRPFEMLQDFDKAGAFDKLKGVVRNLGEAFNVATPQGQKLSKALIGLADTVVGSLFGPLEEATKGDALLAWVQRATQWAERFKSAWAKYMPQVIDFLRGVGIGAKSAFDTIVSAYNSAKPFIDWLGRLIDRLTGVKEGSGSTAERLGRLVGALVVVAGAAGALSVLLLPIRLLFQLGSMAMGAGRALRGLWNAGKSVGTIFKSFQQWGGLARVFRPLGTAIGWVGRQFATFQRWGGVTRIFRGIGTVFAWIGRQAGALWRFLAPLGRIFLSVGRFALGLGGTLVRLGAAFLVGIGPVGWVILALVAIGGALVWAYNRFEGFRNYVNDVWDAIKWGAGEAWKYLTQKVSDFVTAGATLISGLKNGVTQKWAEVVTAAQNIGADLISGLKNGVTQKWAEVVTAAQNIGAALIDGIRTGISNKWNELKTTVGSTADSVGAWFREKLGINSPSVVFTGYGNNIVDGLLMGIEAGRGRAASTIKSMALMVGDLWHTYAPNLAAKFDGVAERLKSFGNPAGGAQTGQGGPSAGGGGQTGGGFKLGPLRIPQGVGAIATAAMQGITAGWAESMPGYCSRFVRQVFQRVLGPKTNALFGSSAIQSEANFKKAGMSYSLAQLGGTKGLKAGDVLFQGFGSGGFGHTGIYIGNGQVAQNTTMNGGGKMVLPLSAFGKITSVGRVPGVGPTAPTAPVTAPPRAPITAPQPARGTRAGNTVIVQPTIKVPPGTPAEQSNKLKQDAYAASYQGAIAGLEQAAMQSGHK